MAAVRSACWKRLIVLSKRGFVHDSVNGPADMSINRPDSGRKLDLGNGRFASVERFQGSTYISIRIWMQDEKYPERPMFPTKKGISLKPEQWNKLKACIPEIDKQLQNLGTTGLGKMPEDDLEIDRTAAQTPSRK